MTSKKQQNTHSNVQIVRVYDLDDIGMAHSSLQYTNVSFSKKVKIRDTP